MAHHHPYDNLPAQIFAALNQFQRLPKKTFADYEQEFLQTGQSITFRQIEFCFENRAVARKEKKHPFTPRETMVFGLWYEHGNYELGWNTIREDQGKALDYYQKAKSDALDAKEALPVAYYKIAKKTVYKDLPQAKKLLNTAIEMKCPVALAEKADWIYQGRHEPKNISQAIIYYEEAARAGYLYGDFKLANHYIDIYTHGKREKKKTNQLIENDMKDPAISASWRTTYDLMNQKLPFYLARGIEIGTQALAKGLIDISFIFAGLATPNAKESHLGIGFSNPTAASALLHRIYCSSHPEFGRNETNNSVCIFSHILQSSSENLEACFHASLGLDTQKHSEHFKEFAQTHPEVFDDLTNEESWEHFSPFLDDSSHSAGARKIKKVEAWYWHIWNTCLLAKEGYRISDTIVGYLIHESYQPNTLRPSHPRCETSPTAAIEAQAEATFIEIRQKQELAEKEAAQTKAEKKQTQQLADLQLIREKIAMKAKEEKAKQAEELKAYYERGMFHQKILSSREFGLEFGRIRANARLELLEVKLSADRKTLALLKKQKECAIELLALHEHYEARIAEAERDGYRKAKLERMRQARDRTAASALSKTPAALFHTHRESSDDKRNLAKTNRPKTRSRK